MLQAVDVTSEQDAAHDRFMALIERDLAYYCDSRERREHLFLIMVIRLAKDLETAEALCRGEKVPRSRLRPEWAKAYGL